MARKPDKLRVLLAGGGTGGHLFPGLAIADRFSAGRDCDIRFVGTKKGIEYHVVPQKGFPLYTIPISGLYRVGLIKTIKTLAKFPLAFFQSLWILISFRPHIVIGIGGYASGPILALAICLRKRTVIQEQNAYPGLTNRILGKRVPISFVPFKGLENVFKNPVVVGNPIRQTIISAANQPDPRRNEQFTLTILGGSQGAHILNKTITSILPRLDQFTPKLQIIHHTGKQDLTWVMEAYNSYPKLSARVEAFFDNIEEIYLASDLIICRSGSIVNEIAAIGRASVLIPIPSSSGDHQLENAKAMKNAGAAILVEEKELTPEGLFDLFHNLYHSPETIKKMEQQARRLSPGDSAARIVEYTLKHFGFEE